jgi:putative oxidoreductase
MKKQEIALIILRLYLALTMIVHGAARIYAGGVAPFGNFLDGVGFPFGLYLAWAITIFELVGGLTLITGYFVPVLALVFAFELLMGIILVHAPNGWFVVGLGRNGMEYSVLLIVAFICVAISGYGKNSSDRISAGRK